MKQARTPGEILQLPQTDEVVLLSGAPPIKAKKARYYADQRLQSRVLTAPESCGQAEARAAPIAANIPVEALNFAYRLSGDRPAWRPVRVFDDGRQTFIEFPESVAQGQMPPLFGLGEGNQAELLNYRVSGRFMIVDRLLERAELRLGDRRSQQRVEIRKERRRTPS